MNILSITALFIALVFFVLMWNAALLWFVRRGLQKVADRGAKHKEYVNLFLVDFKVSLGHLESLTNSATEWSSRARKHVHSLEGSSNTAENWLRYSLAKLDFNVDKVSERLDNKTKGFKSTLLEPLFRTATVLQGTTALLELLMSLRRSKGGSPPSN